MKRWALLLFCFLVLFALPLAAQDATHKPFDISLVEVVVLVGAPGLFGIGVKGFTQMIKGWLKWDGKKAIFLSVGVSIVLSTITVVKTYAGEAAAVIVVYSILLSALVALAANGLYRSGKPNGS